MGHRNHRLLSSQDINHIRQSENPATLGISYVLLFVKLNDKDAQGAAFTIMKRFLLESILPNGRAILIRKFISLTEACKNLSAVN